MAETPEGKVKRIAKGILKARKIHYSMPVTGGFGVSGDPDFTLCCWGIYFGMEAKADATKKGPTELQKLRMEEIRDSGGFTLLIDKHNVEKLAIFFDGLAAHRDSPTLAQDIIINAKLLGLWYDESPAGKPV